MQLGDTVFDSRPGRGRGIVVSVDSLGFIAEFPGHGEEIYTPASSDIRATHWHLIPDPEAESAAQD